VKEDSTGWKKEKARKKKRGGKKDGVQGEEGREKRRGKGT